MTENRETTPITGEVEVSEPKTTYEIVYSNLGISGLKRRPAYSTWRHQAEPGGEVDFAAVAADADLEFGDDALGIKETTTTVRKFNIRFGGEEKIFQDEKSSAINIWVGDENVKLLTPEEADEIVVFKELRIPESTVVLPPQKALDSARSLNDYCLPERVVRAQNGIFYPATVNDRIVVASPEQVGKLSKRRNLFRAR